MTQLELLIKGCIKGDSSSQEAIYSKYAPLMLGIAMRYCDAKVEAEDVLQEAFFKILTRIQDYKGVGSFEGWMKRIVVTTAIDHYRKKKRENKVYENIAYDSKDLIDSDIIDEIAAGDLIQMINEIPEAHRIILNLYSVEGYSHKEIAEMLNINEGNSRAKLLRAKKMLQNKLKGIFSIVVAT